MVGRRGRPPAEGQGRGRQVGEGTLADTLFGWLVADGWCWFVLREEYCWLVAAGCWFVLREKYCWLVADKPSEQASLVCLCIQHEFNGNSLLVTC
jgi:hypothetical protein